MFQLIKSLNPKTFKLEIISIINKHEDNFSQVLHIPEYERFTSYPKTLIEKSLNKAQVHTVQYQTHIETIDTPSLTKTVNHFLNFVNKSQADTICLFTNSQKTNTFFSIGSFTETVIYKAKQNILLLNPKAKVSSKLKTITFALDFNNENLTELKYIMKLAKQSECKLFLVYHANMVYNWTPNEPSKKVQKYRDQINAYKIMLTNILKQHKINFEIKIITAIHSTTEVLLQEANAHKSNLIIINSKHNGIKSIIGGSVTRKLIRSSHLPILIVK